MKTINLPAVFDRMVAIELAPEIADALGGGPGVTIAAGDVRQIGQCGVQLLLSAALTASRRGLAFVIQDASEAFENARSEEHTSELQSLMRISYAVFCLKKKKETDTKSLRYTFESY